MMNLYVDMDGVISDFDEFIKDYYPEMKHHERFRKAVTEENVFEVLDDQEGGLLLMETIEDLKVKYGDKLQVNFLTSVGTKDPELGTIVAQQKQKWLDDRKYLFKPLFFTEKKFKAKYAHEKALLIDDRPGSVEPFREAGGRAILHTNASMTVEALIEHLEVMDG